MVLNAYESECMLLGTRQKLRSMNVHKIIKQYARIILNVKDKRQVSTVTLFCNLGWLQIDVRIYYFLCGTKLPTKELLTWNRGSFAEDNKVKCMFVYELYNKPNIKMQYNNMYTSYTLFIHNENSCDLVYIFSLQNISKGGGTTTKGGGTHHRTYITQS